MNTDPSQAANHYGLFQTLGYIRQHPVGRRQPLRTLWRIVRWQAASRLGQSLRPTRWCNDSTLLVRRGMTGVTGNIYYGLHEFSEMACVAMFLRPDDIFADVGANAGTYTILASKVAGARTIAFEPGSDILPLLEAQIAANDIADKVVIIRKAVGERVGTAHFSTGLNTMNRVVEDGTDSERVPITTLDAELAARIPIAIKLDIEGGEPGAIAGARALLENPVLRLIVIETTDAAIERHLRDAGFAEYAFDPFARDLRKGTPDYKANNRLFVRDPKFVRRRLAEAPTLRVVGLSL